ncbi:MAG TPA: hypothetical protein VNZ52_02045 [Candidatus Thermoplasmatota archaeon]|nr:hypothetical protein [Candidatus Thermoplasmatota archaeon]
MFSGRSDPTGTRGEAARPRASAEEADRPRRFTATHAVALVLLVGISIYAGMVRTVDPASTPVVGAEDPYTHMVFVKEHLDRGYFDDSFWIGTGLYPPGMHAWVAAVVATTGVDLYEFTRWAPIAWGVLAVIGTFLLVARYAGVTGGAVAGFLIAQSPEHIFRTTLLFPTALDLALMPFAFLGLLLLVVDGERWGGAALFGITTLALTYAHPWMGFIICGVSGILLVVHYLSLIPAHRDGTRNPKMDLTNHLVATGLMVPLFAFAVNYNERYDGDKGFLGSAFGRVNGVLEGFVGSAFIGWVLLVGGIALFVSWALKRSFGPYREGVTKGNHQKALLAWMPLGLLLGAGLAWQMYSHITTHGHELPVFVNYKAMLGIPLIVLALAGIAIAFMTLNPAGLLGALTVALLFPVTVADLFNSWYLPHRTVVYVLFGAAVAAGAGVGALAEHVLANRAPVKFRTPARATLGAVAMAGVLFIATTNAASTYDWYRLYEPDEFEGIQDVIGMIREDETMFVAAPNWQSNLLLRALGDGVEDQVGWGEKLFTTPEWRERFIHNHTRDGHTLYVIMDGHMQKQLVKKPEKYYGDWLRDTSRWQPEPVCCDGNLTLYRYIGPKGGTA